jgi:hypothetical protein
MNFNELDHGPSILNIKALRTVLNHILIIAVGLMIFSTGIYSAENYSSPKLPYYDWGACPFECCTYRTWTAKENVVIKKHRNKNSPVLYTIQKGDNVQGLTGVVITKKYGRIKALKPITLDKQQPISLKPGDVIYTLHYLGEGFELFWYDGKVYSDEIAAEEIDRTPLADQPLQVLDLPVTEWWVKIRNKKGQIGWTNETDKFDHMDACE